MREIIDKVNIFDVNYTKAQFKNPQEPKSQKAPQTGGATVRLVNPKTFTEGKYRTLNNQM